MNTCRRDMIDSFLISSSEHFKGIVLDIGGKKNDKRGLFNPPINLVKEWLYLNIDVTSSPDIIASADQIPLPDASVDTFILCEVLEYLEHPEASLAEASRILTNGGNGIITIPFLHPIHPDLRDYQRWTAARIKLELERAGLEVLKIYEMGGFVSVLLDIFHVQITTLPESEKYRRCFSFHFLKVAKHIFRSSIIKSSSRINTGYGVLVRKP